MNEKDLFLINIIDGEDKSSVLGNCLRNQYRHLRKWAKRTQTDCFRLYDRDIHHYPLAIDYYAGRFCVQYFARGRDDEEPSQELQEETMRVLGTLFGVTPDQVYWRTRKKSKETRQYEKIGESQEFFTAHEYGLNFQINLVDYLDTGLFLDHRETRRLVALESKNKRVLNLFAYTCSFSVHAAAAGAIFTKSVDMSNTYTAWGIENFKMNAMSLTKNVVVRADCLKFLDEELKTGTKYDLIIIDPPTISRSKKMDQLFDIQQDYISLILKAKRLLLPGGTIFFSTNSRKFTFDETMFSNCLIKEISDQTIPIDFKDKKIHRCWKITV